MRINARISAIIFNEVKIMSEYFESREMNEYFDTLPKSVQESFIESGARPENLEQMKAVVNAITTK